MMFFMVGVKMHQCLSFAKEIFYTKKILKNVSAIITDRYLGVGTMYVLQSGKSK